MELGLRLWLGRLEAAECFLDLDRCPARDRARRRLRVGLDPLGRPLHRRGLALARFRERLSYRLARGLLRGFAARFLGHVPGIVLPMTADNADDLEPTIFSAVLTPHRSLHSTGFLI